MRTMSLFSLFVFLLTACGGNDVDPLEQRYTGQSNQWEATFDVNDKMELELVYIGDDPAMVNDISFTMEIDDRGFGGDDFRLNGEGHLNTEFDWDSQAIDDETIEVTIEWDGNQEMVRLTEE